jgi:ElaB/YqjD/DUF883 family membrane-anchored ribosome-binding protein
LAPFIPALRRTHAIHLGNAISSTSTLGAAVGSSWSVAAPVEFSIDEKVDALWELTNRLHEEFRAVDARHQQTSSEMRQKLQAAVDEARENYQETTHRISKMQDEQVELNAAAFPLIGFGIVISSMDTELAALPLWADLSVLGVATAVSVRVVGPNIHRWQVERRKRKAIEFSKRTETEGRES